MFPWLLWEMDPMELIKKFVSVIQLSVKMEDGK
jgi:hypothetical protein